MHTKILDTKTFLAMLARTGLKLLAGFLVGHGYLQASASEAFIGAGMALAAAAWSFWNDYGAAIAQDSLDILRDKVQLAAARARRTPAAAPDALAKLDLHVAATAAAGAAPSLAPLVVLAIGLCALALAGAGPAGAQASRQPPHPAGNPIVDIGNAIRGQQQQRETERPNALDELAAKIKKLSLDDFKYASALAHATGNNVTAPCWDVSVKLLTAQQQPLNGPDGQPLKEPDPHLATDIELLSEIIRQLQPNSELSVACAPMASAAQKDAGTLIGSVLSGGALGLFKIPFALP
jgi:hypothetical protein